MEKDLSDYIGEFETEFHTWQGMYESSKWLVENLDFSKFRSKGSYVPEESIYASCIINLASAIEGFTKEAIKGTLEQNYMHTINNPIASQLNLKLTKKISNSTWEELKSYLDLIIEKDKLKSFVQGETWKTIQILFSFRNKLVHGQMMRVTKTISRNEETKAIEVKYHESTGQYKKIFEYLMNEKKVAKKDKINEVPFEFLTKDVLKFFLKAYEDFIDFFVNNSNDQIEFWYKSKFTNISHSELLSLLKKEEE